MHKQNTHDENGMLQAELVPKVVLKYTNRIHMMKMECYKLNWYLR